MIPKKFWKKIISSSKGPPRVSIIEIMASSLGGFLGIALVALIHQFYFAPKGLLFLIAPFGASAVLIYGTPKSPLAQPRNLIGGHILSALSGVIAYKLFASFPWAACAMAVSLALFLMHLTRTLHPPGGATALLFILGGDKFHNLGLLYPLFPVASGLLPMLLIAIIVNNLFPKRNYPEYWW